MTSEAIVAVNGFDTLEAAEAIIEDEFAAFVRVGHALESIRDQRLYRKHEPPWETFEAYCRERWQIGRTYADSTIASMRVTRAIQSESKDDHHDGHLYLPQSERVARELVPVLAIKGAPAVAETWQIARERHEQLDDEKPITASEVRRVVAEMHPDLAAGRTERTPLQELTDLLAAYEPRARALLRHVGRYRHQSLSAEMREDLRTGADRLQAQADALRALADGHPPSRDDLRRDLGFNGS